MSQTLSVRVLSLLLCTLLIGAFGSVSAARGQSSCAFDGELKISPANIISDSAPVLGNRSADVILIEFFDPNCHACKQLHPAVKDVVEKYGDRITFYMHPIPVWRYSVRQIESLLLTQQKGKYYEMVDLQLKHQRKRGLNVNQIANLADSLGIDSAWMRKELKGQTARKQVRRLSFQARKAGVKSTPTLAIGRKIISSSQPTSCIGRLVERTLEGRATEEGTEE